MYLKNTAGQFICFSMISATDGSPVTGITPAARRCIDGTFAAAGATITEDTGLGFYKAALTQADTNGNNIAFRFTGTGAIDVTVNIVTTSLNLYDSVRAGLTALPNAAADAAGGLPISDAGGLDMDALATAANPLTVASGTIGATGNDTTHLHLTGLTFGDDELNQHLLVITDDSGSEIHSRWITDWVLSTELATLHEALPFTPQDSTDTYVVLAIRADSPSSLDLGVIVDAVWNATLSSYSSAGSTGKALADVETDATAILVDTNELQTDDIPGTLATIAGYLDTEIAAIKAKTDSLTFTVAGNVDANVQYVNDVQLVGDGDGTPMDHA